MSEVAGIARVVQPAVPGLVGALLLPKKLWAELGHTRHIMRTLLQAIALVATGFVAGVALYGLCALLLVGALAFYAVSTGLFVALAVWIVGAPILYIRLKNRGPRFAQRLSLFLGGMLLFLGTSCVQVAVYTPHTIIPW